MPVVSCVMSREASTRQPAEAAARQVLRARGWPWARREALLEAVGGLHRNGLMAAAATSTIAIALMVAGGGVLASVNLAHMASVLESQVEIVGFLRRDLTLQQQHRVLDAVRDLPGVRAAELVGRAEALRRLQKTYESLASVGYHLKTNPLPDSIEVRASGPGQVRAVAAALEQISGVEEVLYGTPVVDRLVALTRAVRIAGTAVAGALSAAALLIVLNTIRLTVAARRQEIEIMTLVGATPGFIRGPFVLEGVLQGAAAALSATVVLVVGYSYVAVQIAGSMPFLPVLQPKVALPGALAAVWFLGIAVGVAGSEIGMRRYLRP